MTTEKRRMMNGRTGGRRNELDAENFLAAPPSASVRVRLSAKGRCKSFGARLGQQVSSTEAVIRLIPVAGRKRARAALSQSF